MYIGPFVGTFTFSLGVVVVSTIANSKAVLEVVLIASVGFSVLPVLSNPPSTAALLGFTVGPAGPCAPVGPVSPVGPRRFVGVPQGFVPVPFGPNK